MVGERLDILWREIAKVMEPIQLCLDDYDSVVYSVQLSGMNRVVAMIQDSISAVSEGFSQLTDCRVVGGSGLDRPLLQSLLGLVGGPIAQEIFEFVLKNEHCIDDLVQPEQFFQMLPFFNSMVIPLVFQHKILGFFEDCFVGPRGFLGIHCLALYYDSVKLAY